MRHRPAFPGPWVVLACLACAACSDPRSATGTVDQDGGIHGGSGTDGGPATDSSGTDVQTSDSAGQDVPDGKDAAPLDVPCSGATPRPDGTCCPSAQAYDPGTGTCATFGPAGCTGTASECVPRWCLDWKDATGAVCSAGSPGCQVVGRACTALEVASGAGCPAGQAPSASGCLPAGSAVPLPASATWSADELVLPAAATAVDPADLDPGAAPATLPPAAAPLACPGGGSGCATPCAVGTVADASGTCAPLTGVAWTCPPGFLAAQAPAAACVPDPADCGTDPFAGVQDAAGTVFVDASATAPATGKRAAPFANLDPALAALPEGGTIVVAAGTYATALETQKKLTIRGRCAALVTLQGKTGFSVVHGFGPAQVQLRGVSVLGGREPLRFDGPALATLDHVQISGGTRFGLLATGNAVVTAQDLFVHDIQPSTSDQSVGQGLHASGGAHLTVQDVRLSVTRDRGLYADGAGTVVTASGLVVDGTLAELAGGLYGDGLSASGGAQVLVQGARFTGNRNAAVLAIGVGSAVTLTDAWIDGTLPQDADGKGGRGVTVLSGAAMDLRQVRTTGNRATGVLADGPGTTLHARALQVAGTLADQGGSAGQGVDVEGGAHAVLEAVHGTGNHSEGVLVLDAGTEVTMTSALIENTLPRQKDQGSGVGLSVDGGARATLLDVRVKGNRFAGLYSSGAGTRVALQGTIDASEGGPDGKGGYGVLAEAGAQVAIQGRVSGNHAVGLLSVGQGTRIDGGPGLLIDATLPQIADEWGGRAAGVEEAGTLTLHDAILWKNRDVAVYAQGQDGLVELTDTAIVQTKPRADGHGGHGVNVLDGARAVLQQVRVVGSTEVGVLVHGTAAQATVQGLTIAATLARSDGKYGRGLQISAGGHAILTGEIRSVAHADAGVVIDGAGSQLTSAPDQPTTLRSLGNGGRGLAIQAGGRLQVSQVQAWQDVGAGLYLSGVGAQATVGMLLALQTDGRGVEVRAGATLAIQAGAVLASSREIALMVSGPGTLATATGLRIVQTAPAKDHLLGHGVQVQDGAKGMLLGARITGQREAGVLVRGGNLEVAGAWIAAGTPLDVQGAGLGAAVIAAAAGQVLVRGCRLEGLLGAGLLVDNAAATLDSTLVRDVQAVPPNQPADAVLAHGAASLQILSSWLTQAARAGVLVDGKSATILASRIDANGVGVALQHGAMVTESASQVTGNGQDHSSGTTWPLPGPPAAANALADLPVASP